MSHALNSPKPNEGFPAKGECEHKNLKNEVCSGMRTDDKICMDCGLVLTPKQVEAAREKNSRK